MKSVLILGAGLVAGPMVRYLLEQPDIHTTVASRTASKASALIGDHPRGTALAFDIAEESAGLNQLVQQADLVVSLLPYTYHLQVAHSCLQHGKHLVTTSYVKPEMQALDAAVRQAGVIFLNEIGLDPGIDHMSAKRVVDAIRQRRGEITTFVSYCGGLPAPEANTNPLGYKFSWSPRGVVMAGKNPAKYLWEGKRISIPGEELFDHYWPVEIEGLGTFEGYPNRDSMPYAEIYGIEPTHTMFRGTLRYPGWCATLKKIAELGLLDDTVRTDLAGSTFAQLTSRLAGVQPRELRTGLAAQLGLPPSSPIMDNLAWLGLLGDDPLPATANTLMDVLTGRMLQLMVYQPGERDLIVLYDVFYARYSDRTERTTSTLVAFGIPNGDSAMARTVSLPAAIGVRLILNGKITARGVHVPVIPEIYNPVLDELEALGIRCVEETTVVPS
jgi:saccharopine dehydrogenase-like NADP-dependent oxidoreductase